MRLKVLSLKFDNKSKQIAQILLYTTIYVVNLQIK